MITALNVMRPNELMAIFNMRILECFLSFFWAERKKSQSPSNIGSRHYNFAGGDIVTGAATVILAMGAGKLGAKSIDEYLSNK